MTRAPRLRGMVLTLFAAGSVLTISRSAVAFCRTWNCDPTVKTCPRLANDTRDDPSCPGGTAPVYWPTSCVGFTIQQNASSRVSFDAFVPIAEQAFAVWQDVRCDGEAPSVTFSFLGPVACDRQEFNPTQGNANILVFRDDTWPYKGDVNTLALTTLTFNPNTGEIYDADMEINSTSSNQIYVGQGTIGPTEADLLSVITHEAGHFIGIAHSTYQRDSNGRPVTMWAKYARGTTEIRTLSLDDQAAVCAIYPPSRTGTVACDPSPRNGFSTTCGDGSTAARSSAASTANACAYGVTSRRPPPMVANGLLLGVLIAGLRRRRCAIVCSKRPDR